MIPIGFYYNFTSLSLLCGSHLSILINGSISFNSSVLFFFFFFILNVLLFKVLESLFKFRAKDIITSLNMIERDSFNLQSLITQNQLISSPLDLNQQSHLNAVLPILSNLQVEPVLDYDPITSRGRNVLGQSSGFSSSYPEQHDPENTTFLVPQALPLQTIRTCASKGPNSLFGYDQVLSNVNGWSDNSYASSSSNLWNKLSLSLATSVPNQDHCSELSCRDLSYRASRLPPALLGSKYLSIIQEILSQIASFSFENSIERTSFSTPTVVGSMPFDIEIISKSEARKTKLLTLLQLVDDRYNQCLDEIHTVVSAFHAATELDPQLHARFAMQSISFLYRNLRERISNQILSMGERPYRPSSSGGENERMFEPSFIEKQWAQQQLKRKDQQLWRPQRGLPESSVSVLRTWMFQNFLHPYPKDTEKHLLAMKSGLTRSQVSNWFINARVRLWKPMIEEMYAEMNKKRGGRNEGEEAGNNQRSQMSINDTRFWVNRSLN